MNYKKIVKSKKYFNILNENVIMKKLNIKKYLITKSTDIINNDDGKSHIRSYLQNLILIYTPKCTTYIDDDNPLSIATKASNLHNALQGTQSAIWCPLIYNALKYAGHNIPYEWTIYNTSPKKNIIFQELSKKLAEVPLWNQYTACILMYYKGPQFDNDFFTNGLIDKSNEIRDNMI
jgi:hypothetical protein